MDAATSALIAACVLLTPPSDPEPFRGFKYDANFTISATTPELAAEVLAMAGELRKSIALEWLGEELPASVGPASIQVRISDSEDKAHTWVIDKPDRRYHLVWITTSREKLKAGLAHELTHCILSTQYRNKLPIWANEAIASLSDDAERTAGVQRTLDWLRRTENWPDLKHVLNAATIPADDHLAYCVASSVAEFLLQRGNKATLLKFATAGARDGWDSALSEHYKIDGTAQLQREWQAWAKRRATTDRGKSGSVPSATAKTATVK